MSRVRVLKEMPPNPTLKPNVIDARVEYIIAKCSSPYKITFIDGEGYQCDSEAEADEYVHRVDGDEEDFDEDTENATLNCLRF